MSLPETFVPGFHDETSVRKMEYLPFGKTGMKVSKISLGGGTLAGTFYGSLDEQEGIAAVHEALKKGINYIDTAPYYGQGRSEEVLGKALKGIPRKAYYIATKVGRYDPPDTYTQFDYSAKKTRESIEKSLKLLGVDYVDVVTIHDVEFEEDLTPVLEECLPTLEALRTEGKIKFIGVSAYPLSRLREVMEKVPGRFNTVLAYARNTLIDNSLADYLTFFQEQGLAIICAAGHAMRLLTNIGPFPWHPADDETKKVCKQAAEFCEKNGVDLGKLAMYHFIQMRGPSTFLVGMQTRQLLEINLEAYFNGLNDKEKQVLEYVNKNYFCNLKNRHWEGVEIKRYREFMKTK
uniref:CSON015539 protein n=1 Tax=Culicoides sonorensis TaxID=179676 RepID=A0A336MHC6_CULSO